MTLDTDKLAEIRAAVLSSMMALQTFGDTEEGVNTAYSSLKGAISRINAIFDAPASVRDSPTKSLIAETSDTDELVVLMLNELHANVPEIDRPMSMMDLSDDQAARARRAVIAVLLGNKLAASGGSK